MSCAWWSTGAPSRRLRESLNVVHVGVAVFHGVPDVWPWQETSAPAVQQEAESREQIHSSDMSLPLYVGVCMHLHCNKSEGVEFLEDHVRHTSAALLGCSLRATHRTHAVASLLSSRLHGTPCRPMLLLACNAFHCMA